MYNLNREKLIILFLALPLCILSLFLVLTREGLFAQGATEQKHYTTETYYEKTKCKDCNCESTGKKLISFKGMDAECEKYKSEDERMKCYQNNSQASFACPNLESKKEVEDCYEKYTGSIFGYYQGGAGTLVTTQSITSNGARLYLDGFDCNREHIVKTGVNGPNSNAIIFHEGSRDVYYGGNLDIGGDLTLLSNETGLYFGSNVDYGSKNLGNGVKAEAIVDYNNFNGFNLNKCLDLRVLANHRHLMTITGKERQTFAAVEIEKGLEVDGDLKTDTIYFQGRRLVWSQPIRGHFILYYKTGPVAPSECSLGDYVRDTKQPHVTPALEDEEPNGIE